MTAAGIEVSLEAPKGSCTYEGCATNGAKDARLTIAETRSKRRVGDTVDVWVSRAGDKLHGGLTQPLCN